MVFDRFQGVRYHFQGVSNCFKRISKCFKRFFQRFRSIFYQNFPSETPRISTSGRNLGPPTSQGRHMGGEKSKPEMRVAQSVSSNAPKAVSRPHTCSDTFWHTACTVANRTKQGRSVAPATPKRSDASQNIAKRAPPGGAGPNFFRCEK